jgi:hypothetical protein
MPLLMRNRFDITPFFEFTTRMSAKRQGLDPNSFIPMLELSELRGNLYITLSIKTDISVIRKRQSAYQKIRADGH